jgi:hypothetical protein
MNTVERLGYANGQRLEAGDLRLEQQYHIFLRRLLNSGLFTPGVVNGLEVDTVSSQPRQVRVRTGLALDPVGREIVLSAETIVEVPNLRPVSNPLGYFLVIRYSEQNVPATDPWCGTPDGPPRTARVREQPVLAWSEHVPTSAGCKHGDEGLDCAIVLALVVLDAACKVGHIQSSVREYAHPARPSQVHSIAFEGEKDIDSNNSKVLHFQLRGGAAQSASLYLWGGAFSSLYYTELGRHNHGVTGSLESTEVDHQHDVPAHATEDDEGHDHGEHDHSLWVGSSSSDLPLAQTPPPPPPFPLNWYQRIGRPFGKPNPDGTSVSAGDKWVVKERVPVDDAMKYPHPHAIPAHVTDGTKGDRPTLHSHTFSGSVGDGGVSSSPKGLPFSAHGGARHEYLKGLRVWFHTHEITQLILDNYAPDSWTQLGDGSKDHELNSKGIGPIDLMEIATQVGVDMGTEDHWLEFTLDSGGGKVLYNLYVS